MGLDLVGRNFQHFFLTFVFQISRVYCTVPTVGTYCNFLSEGKAIWRSILHGELYVYPAKKWLTSSFFLLNLIICGKKKKKTKLTHRPHAAVLPLMKQGGLEPPGPRPAPPPPPPCLPPSPPARADPRRLRLLRAPPVPPPPLHPGRRQPGLPHPRRGGRGQPERRHGRRLRVPGAGATPTQALPLPGASRMTSVRTRPDYPCHVKWPFFALTVYRTVLILSLLFLKMVHALFY